MMNFTIRPISKTDKPWIDQTLIDRWGSTKIVTRGVLHAANELPGFIAAAENKLVGLLTYRLTDKACEVVSLDSLMKDQGIGSALLRTVEQVAKELRCNRIWLITTNDNIHAVRFYQRRGYLLVAVHRKAIEVSRQLKPQIPIIGEEGIPIRDEIEFEKLL
jgi:N-acetylglutamate synthase-like GNAT family acetyltransferase